LPKIKALKWSYRINVGQHGAEFKVTLPAIIKDLPILTLYNALAETLGATVGGVADETERAAFTALWQARVQRIPLEHADDPGLVIAWQ
jgi:hypothetical protein